MRRFRIVTNLNLVPSAQYFVTKDTQTYRIPTYKMPEQKKFNLDANRIRDIDIVIATARASGGGGAVTDSSASIFYYRSPSEQARAQKIPNTLR